MKNEIKKSSRSGKSLSEREFPALRRRKSELLLNADPNGDLLIG